MDKKDLELELERLISEAPRIAPSIARFEGQQNYGQVTDEALDVQGAQRWEVEAAAILNRLATSEGSVFSELAGEYLKVREESKGQHSKSILVHKVSLLLKTARQLIDSPLGRPEGMIGDASMSTGRGGPEPPEKVTIPWLLKYVPIGLWLAAGSLLVATFIVGFGTSQIPGIYQFLGKADPRGQTTVGPRAHPAGRAEQVLSPIIPKLEGTSWTCTPARCLRGQNPKIDSALKLRDSAGHEFFGELNTGSPLTVQLYEFKNSSEGQSANIGDTFSGSRALKFTDEGGHQFYGEVGGEGPNIVTTYQMTNGYINRGAIVKGIINKDLTEIRWQVDDGNVWRKNVVP